MKIMDIKKPKMDFFVILEKVTPNNAIYIEESNINRQLVIVKVVSLPKAAIEKEVIMAIPPSKIPAKNLFINCLYNGVEVKKIMPSSFFS
jgi:hypothetical protein